MGLGDLSCEGVSPQGCGVTDTNAFALQYVNFTDELYSYLDLNCSVSNIFRPMQNPIVESGVQNVKLNF